MIYKIKKKSRADEISRKQNIFEKNVSYKNRALKDLFTNYLSSV